MKERTLESEISSISSNSILLPSKIYKITETEYNILITIPSDIFCDTQFSISTDIFFLMYIKDNFRINQPKLYSITPFSSPNICDGRDIFEDVNNGLWNVSHSLTEVINSLPKFVLTYLTSLSHKQIPRCGKFYLDGKYEQSLYSKLPVYFKKVNEIYKLYGNKKVEESRYLMISDTYICLFDYEIFNPNNLKLIFYGNIKSLELMREYVDDEVIKLTWKVAKGKKYKMKLVTDEGNKIINLIMGNLKLFGIEYSVKQKILGPKQGTIPEVDIELVEKQIRDMEERIIHEDTTESVLFLMDLYQRAVRYYSAVNDDKYIGFMKKIQNIMINEKYSKLLDKKKEDEEKQKKEKEKEKEKKKEIEKDKKKEKEEEKIKEIEDQKKEEVKPMEENKNINEEVKEKEIDIKEINNLKENKIEVDNAKENEIGNKKEEERDIKEEKKSEKYVNKWEEPKEVEKDELKTTKKNDIDEEKEKQKEQYEVNKQSEDKQNKTYSSSLKISETTVNMNLNFDLDDDDE